MKLKILIWNQYGQEVAQETKALTPRQNKIEIKHLNIKKKEMDPDKSIT